MPRASGVAAASGRSRSRARRPRTRPRPRTAATPAEHAQELVLAVALEAGQADELAGAHLDVDRRGVRVQADAGGAARPSRRPTPARRRCASRTGAPRPGHQLDELARGGARRARSVATDCARAQHGDAVGDLLDLVHAVRDEDHARARAAQRARGRRTGARASRRRAPRSPRRGSGSSGRARAPARCTHACRIAERQRPPPAASRSRASSSSSPSDLARRASRLSACRMRALRTSPSEPSQMFSSTVRWPTTSISWKTVAMPAGSPPAASETAGPARRRSSIVPLSGRCTPARILTSVLFPEPFSPMIACTSPCPEVERAVAERLGRAEALRHLGHPERHDRCPGRRRGRLGSPAPTSRSPPPSFQAQLAKIRPARLRVDTARHLPPISGGRRRIPMPTPLIVTGHFAATGLRRGEYSVTVDHRRQLPLLVLQRVGRVVKNLLR